MDTSEPIVTIKLTTDNSQLLEYLIQLVVVTLIILNVKLVISITTDFIMIALKKISLNHVFYTRHDLEREAQQDRIQYTQLENEH